MDPGLVEIWKQLNDEMRHRDSLFMQVIVSIFLFLGAFGAIIYYVPELKLWMWILGFVALVVACIYVRMLGKAQSKSLKGEPTPALSQFPSLPDIKNFCQVYGDHKSAAEIKLS